MLIKVELELPLWTIWKADVSDVSEGLTLETSVNHWVSRLNSQWITESVSVSAGRPVSGSKSHSVSQSVSTSHDWRVSESFQSVSLRVSESWCQSVIQWVSEWVIESVSDSVSQWVSHWVSEWFSESVSESLSQWVIQWVSEWVIESVSHSISTPELFSCLKERKALGNPQTKCLLIGLREEQSKASLIGVFLLTRGVNRRRKVQMANFWL